MIRQEDFLEFRRAAVFAVLTGNGGGLHDKSPGYLLEKWRAVAVLHDPEVLLDHANQAMLMVYCAQWRGHFEGAVGMDPEGRLVFVPAAELAPPAATVDK